MTNREKFIDKILSIAMSEWIGLSEVYEDFGLDLSGLSEDKAEEKALNWLKSEYKEPEIEYMEVTNDIPRFTEIEVRNRDIDAWGKRYFLAKLETGEHYITTTLDLESYNIYNQARIRKDWDKCKE